MTTRPEERPLVLHWFRSDLRIEDNVAFGAAATRARRLGAVFIVDDALLTSERVGPKRRAFLRDCLEALAADLETRGQRLIVRRGPPEVVLPALVRASGAQVVTWNRDPSAYARDRDTHVLRAVEMAGAKAHSFRDRVVYDASEVHPCQNRPTPVFSPYRKAWWRRFATHPPPAPRAPSLPPPFEASVISPAEDVPLSALLVGDGAAPAARLPAAGAAAAESTLVAFLAGAARHYKDERDRPDLASTSRLSPHLRFGTVSIRHCLRAAQSASDTEPALRRGLDKWIDELIWREFYQAVLDDDPSLVRRNHRAEFDAFEWEDDDAGFEAWASGMTGYPLVDAGMRELRATGWMHNRTRMVVASFLTKHLLIDWRRGEQLFMQSLLDGDPASNSGGWQWAASTGTDAAPEPRIFNPTLQGERFDPDGAYVRRWVPELEALPGAAIHRPWDAPLVVPDYPAPIIDHDFARKRALERHARVAAN